MAMAEDPAALMNWGEDDDEEEDNEHEEEDEDEDEDHAHQILNAIATTTSPLFQSQNLKEDELQWAKQIKQYIKEEEPEVLESLSDFMIAQIAIVTRGNLEEALERAQGYHGFTEEYETIPSIHHAIQCVQDYLVTYNDFIHLSNCPMESPVAVSLLSKSTGFGSSCRLKGYFYIRQSCQSDFTQIREGGSYLVECRGFDCVRNFGIREYQKFWTEFGSWYPQFVNKVRIFHSPTLANVMFSMGRKWLPEDQRDRMKFGCHSPMGPLQNIYCQPNLEMAQYRIVDRVRDGLIRRYEMEKNFRLEPTSDTMNTNDGSNTTNSTTRTSGTGAAAAAATNNTTQRN